eukprot:UN00872
MSFPFVIFIFTQSNITKPYFSRITNLHFLLSLLPSAYLFSNQKKGKTNNILSTIHQKRFKFHLQSINLVSKTQISSSSNVIYKVYVSIF